MSRTILFEWETRGRGGRASALFALSGGGDLRARAPFSRRRHLAGMKGVVHPRDGRMPMLASSFSLFAPLLSPSFLTYVSTHSVLLEILGLIMIPAVVIVSNIAIKEVRLSSRGAAHRSRPSKG